MTIHTFFNYLSKFQGVYTLLTACWPLVDIETFMKVTGPKTDTWLVKTVAVLLVAIATIFLLASRVKKDHWLVIILGMTSSLGLLVIDFYYTASDTIRWVYALDGVLQTIFLLCWLGLWTRRRQLSRDW